MARLATLGPRPCKCGGHVSRRGVHWRADRTDAALAVDAFPVSRVRRSVDAPALAPVVRRQDASHRGRMTMTQEQTEPVKPGPAAPPTPPLPPGLPPIYRSYPAPGAGQVLDV